MDRKFLMGCGGASALIAVNAILLRRSLLHIHEEIMGEIGYRYAVLLADKPSGGLTMLSDYIERGGYVNFLQYRAILVEANEQVIVMMSGLLALVIAVFIGLIFYIIHRQRKSERELKVVAYIDPITNRYNYSKLKVDAQAKLFANYKRLYALVSMDVDKFKVLNDMYGYERGNEVLRTIGDVVASQLDEDEMFGRMVSDHFTILMKFDDEKALCERLDLIVKGIHEKVNVTYVQMSVGVYVISDPGVDFSLMNDRANMAKKENKRNANIGYVFYEDAMRELFIKESELEGDMHHALATKQFEVYLQPKYGLPQASICGAEALVRWNHSTKGFLLPKDFIPLFEQNGFIVQLDFYMLEEVCKLLSKWLKSGGKAYPISVNLSRLHMINADLADDLYNIVASYDIPTSLIEFELTETTIDLNYENLVPILLRLKSYGFMVAIDDFGSGYSSLKLLKDIPADILKIDRDFFHRLDTSEREKIVIKNVIQLAMALDIRVVSEGVETQEQFDFLKRVGCDVAQGFYFARPMGIVEFEKIAF